MAHASPTTTTTRAPRAAPQQRLLSWRYRAAAGPALHLSRQQSNYVATVNGKIADGAYRMEPTACPCGAGGPSAAVAVVDRYGIVMTTVQCAACGTLRFDPYLAPDAVADFYTAYYQDMYARAVDEAPYFDKQKRYGRRLLAFLSQHRQPLGVVAEVGCGAGGALSVFREAGSEVYGCDYSERLIAYGRTRGLERLVHGDIEPLLARMDQDGRRADMVLLHHVFEHLSSPLDWLRRAQSLLAPGGLIVIAVPDLTAIDRYPSPAGDMRQFLHIAHKYNFTVAGLQSLARDAGLHAGLLGVELSTQAPEMWVAFSAQPLPPALLKPDAIWQGSSSALYRRLRRFELGYLWRAVLRKVGVKPKSA